jgi:hypothetical protein
MLAQVSALCLGIWAPSSLKLTLRAEAAERLWSPEGELGQGSDPKHPAVFETSRRRIAHRAKDRRVTDAGYPMKL